MAQRDSEESDRQEHGGEVYEAGEMGHGSIPGVRRTQRILRGAGAGTHPIRGTTVRTGVQQSVTTPGADGILK
jgi:hypothetical protein